MINKMTSNQKRKYLKTIRNAIVMCELKEPRECVWQWLAKEDSICPRCWKTNVLLSSHYCDNCVTHTYFLDKNHRCKLKDIQNKNFLKKLSNKVMKHLLKTPLDFPEGND